MYDIKHLIPNKNSKYTQGYYDKFGPKKYFGPRPIIYRSSLELIFMRKLEFNSNVERWSSEHIVIPYTMFEKKNGKIIQTRHSYNTDFTVILKDGRKFVIEVKPTTMCPLNEAQIKRSPGLYKTSCKWKAAIAWCKQNGYIFKIITEDHLKTKVF